MLVLKTSYLRCQEWLLRSGAGCLPLMKYSFGFVGYACISTELAACDRDSIVPVLFFIFLNVLSIYFILFFISLLEYNCFTMC